jgi:hypothetical protein
MGVHINNIYIYIYFAEVFGYFEVGSWNPLVYWDSRSAIGEQVIDFCGFRETCASGFWLAETER